MVETINKSVCRGVAGRRVGNVKGVVIHNDAGSINATAKHYLNSLAVMSNKQLENGFAHYYIDRNTIVRTEDTYNQAWHTANTDGNANFIGYEVCQSIGASDVDFLANEQVTLKQAAEDLKFYGLAANRNTVKLHNQFSATACPHRSQALHGDGVACQDYFINQIKKFMFGDSISTNYYDSGTHFKCLRDCPTYLDQHFKNKSEWLFSKNSVFGVSKIITSKSQSKHAEVKVNGGIVYVTLDKNWVQKIK